MTDRLQDPEFDATVRALKRTPFRHRGRCVTRGVDCVGVCWVLLPHLRDLDAMSYGDAPTISQAVRALATLPLLSTPDIASIPKQALLVWNVPRRYAHFSVATGSGWHIHALGRQAPGVRHETLDSWWPRLVAAYDTVNAWAQQ